MQGSLHTLGHCPRKKTMVFFALYLAVTAVFVWELSTAPSVLDMCRLAGFIPNSDAGFYYSQVLNWPAESFDYWNSRRPLNSPLNILQFGLGHSTLLGLLLVRIAILALAVSFFIAVLARIAGFGPAVASGILLVAWSLPYASIIASETNGISLAAAGFGCLLLGMQAKRMSWVAWGVLGLAFATALRPYNPLLPALAGVTAVMFMPWTWRKRLTVGVITAALAMVFVVGAPRAAYAAYGHPNGAVDGNTGYTVLGLARGTGWFEAAMFMLQHHPSLSERESNDLMYELAIKTVLENPGPAVKSLISGLSGAFQGLPWQVAGGFGWKIEKPTAVFFLYTILLYTLIVAAILCCARSATLAVVALMLVSLVAFFSIAPVVEKDGGWRIATSLYPGLSMVAACPFFLKRRFWPSRTTTHDGTPASSQEPGRWAIWPGQVVVAFAVLALPYPMLTRALAGDLSSARSHDAFIVRFDESERAARWTGLNEGHAPIGMLQEWIRQDWTKQDWKRQPRTKVRLPVFREWDAFFRVHEKSVRDLRYEGGKLVLTVSDPEAVRNQPDPATMHPYAPRFVIRLKGTEPESMDRHF